MILLTDLATRAQNLRAHYTDFGIFPREMLLHDFTRISFHMMSGAWEFQFLLFALAAVFGVCLLVGYRPRLMTVLSWIFLVSLQNRNYLILQAGDGLLRQLLFWAMFLPLCEKEPRQVFSVATFALLMQLVILYVFTGLLKSGAPWKTDYTAVYNALMLDTFARPMGVWLRQYEMVCRLLTRGVFYLELLGPILFFVPYQFLRFRLFAIACFLGLQLGFVFHMRLGLFPYISTLALIPFLPSEFWDKVPKWKLGFRVSFSGKALFSRLSILKPFLLGFLWVTVLFWNLSTVKDWEISMPHQLRWIAKILRLDQEWAMFAPKPHGSDRWVVAIGKTEKGEAVNLLGNSERAPASVTEIRELGIYEEERWRKYLNNYAMKNYQKQRAPFAAYQCRLWNESHPLSARLASVEIVLYSRETLSQGRRGPLEKRIAWRKNCY